MIKHAVSIVKTALSIPFTVAREGRKLVDSVIGGGNGGEADEAQAAQGKAEAQAAQGKAEIQAAIREQAQASIETVKIAEEIREQTVTAENAPL